MAKKQRQKSVGHATSSQPSMHSQASSSALPKSSSSSILGANTPGQSSNTNDNSGGHQAQIISSPSQLHNPPAVPTRARPKPSTKYKSLYHWIHAEREGIFWILGCAAFGALLGFGVGCGWFTGGSGMYQMVLKSSNDADPSNANQYVKEYVITAWRIALAGKIRKTVAYELATFKRAPWELFRGGENMGKQSGKNDDDDYWASFTRGDAPGGAKSPGKRPPASTPDKTYASSPGDSPISPPAKTSLSKIDQGGQSTPQKIQPARHSLHYYLWPPNWFSIGNIDASQIEVGSRGLSPLMASFLSFVLPWRRPLIQALARDSPGGDSDDSSYSTITVDPYFHPMAFSVLREYVIRFDNGYVHPDLGFLVPAPSGASRGLGMVRNTFNKCQTQCHPGSPEDPEWTPYQSGEVHPNRTVTLEEVKAAMNRQESATTQQYAQQDVLLHIPLEAQITRSTALDILKPLLPKGGIAPIDDLDDAPLLALLLAHERGLGSDSRFWPYITTLPRHPSCGWNREWRQSVVDVITAMSVEMGTDVQGWPAEIGKAADMAEKISRALGREYGGFLAVRPGSAIEESIRWSLCQVSSRAIAGRDTYGSLRLVPILDMVNHDMDAGKFVELTGEERIASGDFVNAAEEDAGAFVLRSRRHGRKKGLRKGQELLANYNVPFYSPMDWFINMGYIPPEREGKWTMLDAGLPRSKRSGVSRGNNVGKAQSGAFGSGKPEVQVIKQRHSQQILQQQSSAPETSNNNQQGTCHR